VTPNSARPIQTLFLLACAALLAACQSVPTRTGFTAEQITVLKTEGFVEDGADWELTLTERLLFPTNESALQPGQDQHLAALARNLASVGIFTARVEGHTDSTGTAAYNLTLSQARAQAVAVPLQAGGMRFTADQVVGRGEAVPMSSNDTADGRQDNRRVVVIVSPQ
jgi:outer membrane protein OmpA-like peptidoglycan-associated protein